MKNQKKIIFEVFIILLSVLLSAFLWKYISIPYKETGIIGNYSMNHYNQNNDLLRYLFFIIFPILTFVAVKYFGDKKTIKIFLQNLKKIALPKAQVSSLNFLFFFFIILILLEFYSVEFNSQLVDVYHDGQIISSAFKSYYDHSLWSGSYIISGIFNETIASKLSWNFFNTVSIGSAKFAIIFIILINKILLTFFAFQISQNSNLKIVSKCFYFLLIFLVFQSLIDYNLGKVDLLNHRELPILILLVALPYMLSKNQLSYIIVFCIGFASLPTFFWSLDRGIIFNLLICLLFVLFFVVKHHEKIFLLLSSIFLSWVFFSYIFGEEFTHFLSNSILILKEINNIHGITHPVPFSDEPNSARATKGLLAIIISIILALGLFLKNNNKYNYYTKLILLFISVCCFLGYLNAIGRSDGGHIKNNFGYPVIFFTVFVLFNFFFFFKKKFNLKILNNIKTKIPFFLSLIIIAYSILDIKPQNVHTYQSRLKTYINLEDSNFIPKNYKMFIDEVGPIIKNVECIQLFTNNAILSYFLKKKNCTKYYFVWAVGSKKVQDDFINELKNTKFIIADKEEFENEFSPSYRLHHLKRYIDENYKEILSSYKFRVLKKIN